MRCRFPGWNWTLDRGECEGGPGKTACSQPGREASRNKAGWTGTEGSPAGPRWWGVGRRHRGSGQEGRPTGRAASRVPPRRACDPTRRPYGRDPRRLILRLPQDCESRRPRDTLSGVTVGGFPCSASRRRVCSRPGPMRFSGSTSRSQAASYERSDPYRAGRSQGTRPCDGQGSRGCRPDASASYTALASERASVQTSFRVQRLCRWKALIITVSGSWLIPAFAVISYKHVLTFVTIAL